MAVAATIAQVLLTLIVIVAPLWMHSRARHLAAVHQHLDFISRDGANLIRDTNVPDSVAVFVSHCIEHARDPRVSRRLLWEFISGDAYHPAAKPPSDFIRQFSQDLGTLSPRQQELFGRFTGHAILCSASSDPVFSILSRRLLLWGLTPKFRDSAQDGSRKVSGDVTAKVDVAVETASTMRHLGRRPAAAAV